MADTQPQAAEGKPQEEAPYDPFADPEYLDEEDYEEAEWEAERIRHNNRMRPVRRTKRRLDPEAWEEYKRQRAEDFRVRRRARLAEQRAMRRGRVVH